MAQLVNNLPAMQETQVLSLGQDDSLEKGMAIHSNILVWKIPWTEEPGGYSPWGHRVSHDWVTNTHTHSLLRRRMEFFFFVIISCLTGVEGQCSWLSNWLQMLICKNYCHLAGWAETGRGLCLACRPWFANPCSGQRVGNKLLTCYVQFSTLPSSL